MRISLLETADSYKLSHFAQYPPGATRASSYVEARGGRFAFARFFGLQALLKAYLLERVTAADIDEMTGLAAAHGLPFDADGWQHVVRAHDGRLPLRIAAVPEGTDVPVGNVLAQVQNTCDRTWWLPSYVETLLLHVWYPTTVATVSALAHATIASALRRTAEDPESKAAFMLHDFGARGVSSVEAAALGGLAHLVTFRGTDTISALVAARAWYAEPMAGFSIPAMEHATVTAWGREGEIDAFRAMLRAFGGPGTTLAMVVDSYDVDAAVDVALGETLREEIVAAGGRVVVRPDSGDPTVVVPRILRSLAASFGASCNAKGYAVLAPCVRVLQGDGMNLDTIATLYAAVEQAGFSAENVAVGMGGGLLQKVDRDTLGFVMKLSALRVDGAWRDVYKAPKTDTRKRSKHGRLALVSGERPGSFETIGVEQLDDRPNVLRDVYRDGELLVDESLATIRARVATARTVTP